MTATPSLSLGRAASASLLDQAASSIQTFLISAAAARWLTASEFGTFSVVFLAYSITLGLGQTAGGEALLVTVRDKTRAAAYREPLGAFVFVGVLGGAAVVACTAFLHLPRALIVVLVPSIGLILCQEGYRWVAYGIGQVRLAATSNFVVLFATVGFLVAIHSSHAHATAALMWAGWGAAAGLGALVPAFARRLVPSPFGAARWLTTHWRVTGALGGEFLAGRGAGQAALALAAIFIGRAGLASLRAADILFGPVRLLAIGARPFAISTLSRSEETSKARLRNGVAVLALAVAVLAGGWSVLVVAGLGPANAHFLNHPRLVSRSVAIATAAGWFATAVGVAPLCGLRVLRQTTTTFKIAVISGIISVVAALAITPKLGTFGAAAATSGASLLSALLLAVEFRRRSRRLGQVERPLLAPTASTFYLARRPSAAALLCATGLLILSGGVFLFSPVLALALATVPFLLLLALGRGTRTVAVALGTLTCFSGLRLGAFGLTLLPEHVALVLGLVVLVPSRKEPLAPELRRILAVLLGVVGTLAISTLLNSPHILPSARILAWFVSGLAVLWLCTALHRERPDHFRLLLRAFCVVTGVIGGGAFLIEAAVFVVPSLRSLVGVGADGRLLSSKAFAFEPNLFGAQCLAAYCMSVSWSRLFASRARVLIVLGCLAGLVASDTRAVVVGIVFFELARRWGAGLSSKGRRGTDQLVLAMGMAVTLVGVAVFVPAVAHKLTNFASGTGLYRVTQWNQALHDVGANGLHLLGFGMNTFGQFHLNPLNFGQAAYLSNLWLALLYDGGYLTLIGFIVSCFLIVRTGEGMASGGERIGMLGAILIASVATNSLWFGFAWLVIAATLLSGEEVEGLPPEAEPVGLVGDAAVHVRAVLA